MKKIAVFADVQNIYYTTRQAYGRQFNYRKLWQRLGAEGDIVSAIAYATHRSDDKQLKFQFSAVTALPWVTGTWVLRLMLWI
jgi:uncharacterized LabA/DUF88 family protein